MSRGARPDGEREGTEGRATSGLPRGNVCDLQGGVGELGPANRNVDLEAFRSILRVRALGADPSGHRLEVGRRVNSGPDLESENRIQRTILETARTGNDRRRAESAGSKAYANPTAAEMSLETPSGGNFREIVKKQARHPICVGPR